MKKVLIVDPLSPKGHVIYNRGIIEATLKENDCVAYLSESLGAKLYECGIEEKNILKYPDFLTLDYIHKKIKKKLLYHLLFRLGSIYVVINSFLRSRKFDCVIFTSVDIFSFFVFSYLFGKKTFVVDHGVGNICSSIWYRFFWKISNPKINLIVMESYIKEMVEKNLNKKNVFVLKHPLPAKMVSQNPPQRKDGCVQLFAPGSCNEKKIIEKCLSYNWPQNIRITIKGEVNKKTTNVMVYSDFISNEEYISLFSSADYILILYGDDYNYRSSAVLHEAAVMNKKVFVFSNNTLKNYELIFPKKVVSVYSIKQMLEIINNRNLYFSENPYNLNENCCEYISKQLNVIMGSSDKI